MSQTAAPFEKVSLPRLYILRGLYLLNAVLVGSGVLVEFVHRQGPWDSIRGVAFSFWAALALVSILGIRYPLAMLPVLFMQLVYKTVWFPMVYVPLRAAGRPTDLAPGFLIGIVLDLIAIPWPYVVTHYLRRPGDRWTRAQGR